VIRRLIFDVVNPLVLRMEGNPAWPVRRRVRPVEASQESAFDALLGAGLDDGGPINYDLPYRKVEFLNYACDWRGLVAHGTQLDGLRVLEPIRLSSDSSDFGNLEQIFCSPDAIWAMWFAILDKSKAGVTRNGCVRIGEGAARVKYYHFALPAEARDRSPFTNGTIYLARAEDFPSPHNISALQVFGGDYEEWGSSVPVEPLARISVGPHDFPYLDRVLYYL